jgi:hypothetical protein
LHQTVGGAASTANNPEPSHETVMTLAHEMIHQWQYDILKRRPNHGADFRRMMVRMNRDGLGITIYHSLGKEVAALAKYAWRCQHCGCLYQRQRRTIQPTTPLLRRLSRAAPRTACRGTRLTICGTGPRDFPQVLQLGLSLHHRARTSMSGRWPRQILFGDIDAMFASAAVLADPSLRGKAGGRRRASATRHCGRSEL